MNKTEQIDGDKMTYVEKKNKNNEKAYGAFVYVGETESCYLATHINCEGIHGTLVHALPKDEWRIRE